MRIELITAATLARRAGDFARLLRDAVSHGASIGFTLPLVESEVAAYWTQVGVEIGAGRKILLAAVEKNRAIAGSAQLALESRANGRHRAEIQKVMVRAACRGRGFGRSLMVRVEAEARRHGRQLLCLDTSEGESGAAKFYERLGYAFVGSIPDYASDPDGRLVPNAIFYKKLA